MTMTDTGIIKLNQAQVTRKYSVSVKFVEGTRDDFNPAYNAANIAGDYTVEAATAEEAILKLHDKFTEEDTLSSWVRFEVYEEETVVTRRRIHIADRKRRNIEAIHAKYADSKAEADAHLEKFEDKFASRMNNYNALQAEAQKPKRHTLFGWITR